MSLSNHHHPRPATQKIIGFILTLAIFGVAIGSIGLVVVGIVFTLPFLWLAIPFLMAMSVPLLLKTSLHPAILVEEEGLWLYPLVWKASFVRWEELDKVIEHSLLKPTSPQRFTRKKHSPHEGLMIVAQSGLPWHYRFVGLMAGVGFQPLFAISNTTHVDYEKLRETVKKHLRKGKKAE